MRIRDLMHNKIVNVLPTMTLKQAAILLNDADTDEAFVVNDMGILMGYINKMGFIKAFLYMRYRTYKICKYKILWMMIGFHCLVL